MNKIELLKAMRKDARYNEFNAENTEERDYYNKRTQEIDKQLADERIRLLSIKK